MFHKIKPALAIRVSLDLSHPVPGLLPTPSFILLFPEEM